MSAGISIVKVLFRPGIGADWTWIWSQMPDIGAVFELRRGCRGRAMSDGKCVHCFPEPSPSAQGNSDYMSDKIEIGGGIVASATFRCELPHLPFRSRFDSFKSARMVTKSSSSGTNPAL